ncbi:uncharacterized protein B0I36DRAFT_64365 [Microdochium trichocladiopsis]|uniref:Uncharacterized protein n=1 Tax=Microdochium trichocladiopsis TaxID=1682393 RepID=A0A9P8YG12_9PEZI|nr:uncharacterized protein B0I36DRAFT_64365 [Microdochium trichocladiopsis]KAH7037314.1 hypothetical protein B0I36DRAFT_64365 [Microdochium trichocladiopsis]
MRRLVVVGCICQLCRFSSRSGSLGARESLNDDASHWCLSTTEEKRGADSFRHSTFTAYEETKTTPPRPPTLIASNTRIWETHACRGGICHRGSGSDVHATQIHSRGQSPCDTRSTVMRLAQKRSVYRCPGSSIDEARVPLLAVASAAPVW